MTVTTEKKPENNEVTVVEVVVSPTANGAVYGEVHEHASYCSGPKCGAKSPPEPTPHQYKGGCCGYKASSYETRSQRSSKSEYSSGEVDLGEMSVSC